MARPGLLKRLNASDPEGGHWVSRGAALRLALTLVWEARHPYVRVLWKENQ